MRGSKAIAFLAIILGLSLLLGACGSSSSPNPTPPAVALVSISVGPSTMSIIAGNTQQFSATGTFSDGSTKVLTSTANWLSSNSSVATINVSGLAAGASAGTSIISATSGSIVGSTTLNVTIAPLLSIAVTGSATTVAPNSTVQFTATGTYADGSTRNITSSATWGASAGATITASGLATGVTPGTTSTITAMSATISGTAILAVLNPLVSITVKPTTAALAAGFTQAFTAIGTYADGSASAITSTVTWSSSGPAVATASNSQGTQGLASALAPGSTLITATSGSIISPPATLAVTSATLVSVAVTPASASISLANQQQYTATGTFTDGTTQNITNDVTWTSSDTTKVVIVGSGLATGVAITSSPVTITASKGTVQGTAMALVNAANVLSIAITPGNPTIAQGTSEQFTAIATLDNGSTLNVTSQVTWTSSDTSVSIIGLHSGFAKSLKPGTSSIAATLGSISDFLFLNVTNATIASITVAPPNRTIAPQTRIGFTATGSFRDGTSQVITSDCAWVSDNTAAAAMDGSTATGVALGTATIAADFSFADASATGSAALMVSGASLNSISISPVLALLGPSTTLGFSATGTFSDHTTQNVNSLVSWASSNPSVVSINSYGVATGQRNGTATISATVSGLGLTSNVANIVVEATPLQSIAITPVDATVPQTISTGFTATGIFGDGGKQNLTPFVTWASSNGSVATVSNSQGQNGIATGISPGTASLMVVFAGQVGSTSLTVTNTTLVSITVTPSSPSLALGKVLAFTAIGTFADGTSLSLSSSQVTWNSSDVTVAVINAAGAVTSAKAGTTTITASLNGVDGTSVLTVY